MEEMKEEKSAKVYTLIKAKRARGECNTSNNYIYNVIRD